MNCMSWIALILIALFTLPLSSRATMDCPKHTAALTTKTAKKKPAKKLDKETLAVGDILELKPELKATDFNAMGMPIAVPTDTIPLYVGPNMGWDGGHQLPPGTKLRVTAPYTKIKSVAKIEVEIVGTDIKGSMHWQDVQRNALVMESAPQQAH